MSLNQPHAAQHVPSSTPNTDHNTREEQTIGLQYGERLGEKLSVIEELRADLAEEINCPGVVVVGNQSAGKSSLLERLTGISFPRGDNLCTKVPIVVQLLKSNEPRDRFWVSKHADFSNREECETMAQLSESISRLSAAQVKQGSIGEDPVHIRIFRNQKSKSHAITLIDLPGIAETDANQDLDRKYSISDVTSNLVRKYSSNPNMIVLLVLAATDDFGTSKALKISRDTDPEGERTIGVVTKIDMLLAEGDFEDKMRMRRPNDHKLRLGFYAVRNRKLNDEDVDIDAMEKDLYLKHPQLKNLPWREFGYEALCQRIYHLQKAAVDKFIPNAIAEVQTRMVDVSAELEKLPRPVSTRSERSRIVQDVLQNTEAEISDLITAGMVYQSKHNEELNICDWMHQLSKAYKAELKNCVFDMNMLEAGGKVQVRKLLEQTSGRSLPNFLEDPVMRNLVRRVFFDGSINKRTGKLISHTSLRMETVFRRTLETKEQINPFPLLKDFMLECSRKCIQMKLEKAEEMTEAIIKSEQERTYTLDESYVKYVNNVVNQATVKVLALMKGKPKKFRPPTATSDIGPGVPEPGDDTESFGGRNSSLGDLLGKQRLRKFRQIGRNSKQGEGGAFESGTPEHTEYFESSGELQMEDGLHNGPIGIPASGFAPVLGFHMARPDFIPESFIDKYAEAMLQDARNNSRTEQALAHVQLSAYVYADVVIRRLADIIPMLIQSLMVHGANKTFPGLARDEYEKRCEKQDSEGDESSEAMVDLFEESPDVGNQRKKLQDRKDFLTSMRRKLTNLH